MPCDFFFLGDIQLISEVYDCLRKIVDMNDDMAGQFARWNDGELSSYLIEITGKILNKTDDVTGKGYVVDYVSYLHFSLLSKMIVTVRHTCIFSP